MLLEVHFEGIVPTLAKALNTIIVVVLAIGLWKRHKPRIHIPLMLTCFLVDLINVLIVEFYARSKGKGAVEQATEALGGEASALLTFHIAVSALCLLGYVVAVVTGWKLLKRGRWRRTHKVNAFLFVVTRLASYVTSFYVG